MNTFTSISTFTVFACSSCGVSFALSNEFIAARRSDHRTWHCPNGCQRHWPQQTELEKAQETTKYWQDRARKEELERLAVEERERFEQRRVAATKGVVTKMRQRVGNGVCPCCNRSFENLRRHMDTKHPKFKGDKATKGR